MVMQKKAANSEQLIVSTLKAHKIVILPTDTIYGFSGMVPDTVDLINKAKGRDEGKPFIQLIASPEDICRYTRDDINPNLIALWPGAVTMIVNNRDGSTTAFRCPGDAWLRSIIAKLGTPLYSTSVNRAGEPALKYIADICAAFEDSVDVIIDDGDHPDAKASTIIDCTGADYRIIRQGSVLIPENCLRRSV